MSSYHYLLKVLHYHYLIQQIYLASTGQFPEFWKTLLYKNQRESWKATRCSLQTREYIIVSDKLCLYNSFKMSHFHYCSSIWHHCLKSDSKKLDRLHERALRYLYSDESSQTSTLCDRIGNSLVERRIQNLLIIVFKTINNYPPEYLRDLFRLRDKHQKPERG